MANIEDRTRISRLVGSEKIPIKDISGAFNYTTPADMGSFVKEAFLGTFTKWAAAKARGATSPPRVLIQGDSNVMGEGANSGSTRFAKGFARDFAEQMGWLCGSVLGTQRQGDGTWTIAAYQTYNPELSSYSGGWQTDTGADIIGASFFKRSGGSGNLTFTPAAAFTKLRVWYPQLSGLGSIPVSIDGGSVGTINQNGTPSDIKSVEYSGLANTTHTITFGGTGSADSYLSGFELLNTTSGIPTYLQGGWFGSKMTSHVQIGSAWSSKYELAALAPDYAIMYCNINDMKDSTALNDYYSQLETWLKVVSTTADGCLVFSYPADWTNFLNGGAELFAQALKNLARDYGWSFMDCRSFLGHSYARANDLGYAYNASHPSQAGHDAIADHLYALLADRM